MCDYHSISINRRGTIAHVPMNSHATAVQIKEWKKNTLTRAYHWDFEYNPYRNHYPGALECLTGNGYAEKPTKRVLDVADEHYRRLVALHKGNYSMLEYFSGSDYVDVRVIVAGGPNTPSKILEVLAKDKSTEVREQVACNPHTPTKTLEQLATHKHWSIQAGLAKNTNTPTKILEELAQDPDCIIRSTTARNTSTPARTLARLAKDKDLDVRYQVACNPGTLIETLKILLEDTDPNTRGRARRNMNHKTKLSHKGERHV